MSYDKFRNNLSTGDIVLFSGKGLFSSLIRVVGFTKWSHVGMVVKIDEYDMVLLWESDGGSKIIDVIDGIIKSGVKTVILSEKIFAYDGEIAVRCLQGKITAQAKQAMKDMRDELKNKPYEKDVSELVRAALDFAGIDSPCEDFSSVFCSELVGEALQRMGVIDDTKPANEFVPKDFADGGMIEDHLINGYTYSPEIYLKK